MGYYIGSKVLARFKAQDRLEGISSYRCRASSIVRERRSDLWYRVTVGQKLVVVAVSLRAVYNAAAQNWSFAWIGTRERMPLTPSQLQKTWIDFKVYKSPESRDAIINHYAYLVKITAGRLVTSMPGGLDREDLVGAGVIGLVKSVDQFDPTRDVKFETYAIALIRGAILEMLRDEDWVPRSIREKLKALDRSTMALETKLGRPATEHEVAEFMGITTQEVGELSVRMGRTNVYSLDDILGGTDGDDNIHFVELIVDEDTNPGGEVEGREIRRILGVGVDKLPERERLVVALYYYEGLTFKEIGKVLNVSESRVYQLHTQAMTRLRVFMRQEGAARAA